MALISEAKRAEAAQHFDTAKAAEEAGEAAAAEALLATRKAKDISRIFG
jgi:hypothetical protein